MDDSNDRVPISLIATLQYLSGTLVGEATRSKVALAQNAKLQDDLREARAAYAAKEEECAQLRDQNVRLIGMRDAQANTIGGLQRELSEANRLSEVRRQDGARLSLELERVQGQLFRAQKRTKVSA